MRDEADLIGRVPGLDDRKAIDLGAGYGRTLPIVAPNSKELVAVELNPGMYEELQRRAAQYPNVEALVADMTRLSEVFSQKEVAHAVFLLLQNTLGTIENGAHLVMPSILEVIGKENAYLVLSLFRQQALSTWGIKFYTHIQEMAGEPDIEETDFQNGQYVSRTGYTSKWRSDKEIEELVGQVNGEIVEQIETFVYRIMLIEINKSKDSI